MKDLSSLFNEGTLRVLNYLGSKDRVYITQMQKDIGASYETLYRARAKLDEHKLITIIEGEGGRGSKNWYYLNEKGKKVLELVKQIEETINK